MPRLASRALAVRQYPQGSVVYTVIRCITSVSIGAMLPARLKTEAHRPALDPLRRGRPDPPPLYPAPRPGERDRQGRAARRSRASAAGWSRSSASQLVLHEGRSDLLTVTSAETVAGHPRLREHARGARRAPPAPATRSRACSTTATRTPASTTCSPTSSRCSTASPHARRPRQRARLPPQAAARRRLRAAARRLRLLRRARAPRRASPAPPAAWSAAPARRARSGSTRRPTTSSSARSAARSPRRPTPRQRALAQAERAIGETRRAPRARAAGGLWRRVPLRWRTSKWVYDFAEGSRDMRELLGGKGANVAEMTRVLGAERVPAGFTITTEACVAYMKADQRSPRAWTSRSPRRSQRLEEQAGKTLGDAEDPLLVSVRSGARESMPGMLDTVLNLGLNDESVEGLAAQTENERFAWDSYRRFVQMFGNVARGIAGRAFEDAIKEAKQRARRQARHRARRRRPQGAHREVQGRSTRSRPARSSRRTRRSSCSQAIRAVFDSWTGERAVSYRRAEPHPRRLGHRGQRPADGVRQQGRQLGLRRRVQPRRGDRRAGAVAATSSSTPRARTSSPACATRATSPSSRTSCPRRTRR